MQIDPRYLVPHPETVKWWAQREQCEACRYLDLKMGEGGEGIMRCRAAQRPAALVRRMLMARGAGRMWPRGAAVRPPGRCAATP